MSELPASVRDRQLASITDAGRALGLMEAVVEVMRLASQFQDSGNREAYAATRALAERLKSRSDEIEKELAP